MGRNCIVFGCSNTQKKGFRLFKFPADDKLRKEWTLQVQRTRDQWKGPTKYSAICCEECFELTSIMSKNMGIKMKQRLKSDAIPTIFPRPSSTTTPKRLCTRTSLAFEKRERARVTWDIKHRHTCMVLYYCRYWLRLNKTQLASDMEEAPEIDSEATSFMEEGGVNDDIPVMLAGPSVAVQVTPNLERKNVKLQVRPRTKCKGINIYVPTGNLLLSAAILFAGALPTKTQSF